jgi:hypothetical protein
MMKGVPEDKIPELYLSNYRSSLNYMVRMQQKKKYQPKY